MITPGLGYSAEEFVELYSTVTMDQVEAVLEMVKAGTIV